VIKSVEGIRGRDGDGIGQWISTVLYSLILLVQALSVVMTQSRGPFLAFLVSLFLFALLYLVLRGRRWQGIAVISIALAAGLFLVALNLPNTPLEVLKDLPYVGRLGTIADARTMQMRTLIWEGAVRMSTATPLRALFGYGPDTIRHAFYPYLSPELGEFETPGETIDRLHNETLDTWATTGLLGVAAQLILFGSIFTYGFRWLGLIDSRRRRAALGSMMAGGGILGVVIPWLVDGTLRFSGIGISIGIVLALLVYLALLLFEDQTEKTDGGIDLLLIALLSAIVAHFVEIQTGISITATRTHFWVYAALIGVIGLAIRGERTLEPDRGDRRAVKPGQASLLAGSLLTGLLLVTMAFGLIKQDSSLGSDVFIVLLLLSVWLLAGVGLVFDSSDKLVESKTRGWSSRLFVYSIISLGCLLAFVPFHLANLRPFLSPGALAPTYYASVLLVMLGIAGSLLAGEPLPRRFAQKHWWVYPIQVLVIGAILIRTNLNLVRADTYAGSGEEYGRRRRWDRSESLYRRAVELAPGQDRYHLLLGQAYYERALLEQDETAPGFEEALEALEAARQACPLDPDHYANLGHLYSAWADRTDDLEEKTERQAQALSFFRQARDMAPAVHGQRLMGPTMETHVTLAQSYVLSGMVDRAIVELEAAAELGSPEDRSQLMELISQLRDQAP
jgi:O-antigen ligase